MSLTGGGCSHSGFPSFSEEAADRILSKDLLRSADTGDSITDWPCLSAPPGNHLELNENGGKQISTRVSQPNCPLLDEKIRKHGDSIIYICANKSFIGFSS